MRISSGEQIKDIPNELNPMPAFETDRRQNANLAPQGEVVLDDAPEDSHFTPEGDAEAVPNIPPDSL